jgi:1-acyl-sn-glycerol-3-phosphate acyltransferase
MRKYVLQLVYCVIIRNFLKLIVGVSFDKADFLLKEDRFILIANHNSHLDTMAMMASLPRKIIHKVKPVAAKDYFGKTKRRAQFSNYFLNTVLISRSSNDANGANPIRTMISELDNGYSLIVFPEGTRGEPEVMQPLKKGIALVLLERPEIPYVPVFMYGMGKSMPRGDGLIVPFNSKLHFGISEKIPVHSNKDEIISHIEEKLLELKDQVMSSKS